MIRHTSLFGLAGALYLLSALSMACSEGENNPQPIAVLPDSLGVTSPDDTLTDAGEGYPDSVALTLTDRYGPPIYFYAQVDKRGDYFRRMFMDTASFRVAATTGQIPDGALIAMETWANESSQSSVFYRTKRGDGWLSGSFSPTRPDFSDAVDINSCRNCHQTAQTTDFTFTRPLMQRAARENQVQFIECDRGPTEPCDLEVYLGNL
ncbi:cytochrome P460 family protein [Tunicatimonas pelagia]|uniref:cytochrome P460 family protein n=1 Tax=Tunicatimonas pelagia TaxID=931531 RepID=UPI002665DC60|nr:cytochrome P460 family protein [Tunicatimonas pelagia]WKN42616.1 cytochrome P460 family protein [Tunicatimonas pelagia]